MYCGGLSYIVLPNGLEEIGAGSFADCTNIESIIIPSSVVYINYLAFYGCMNLKEIIFQGNAPTFSKDANSKGQCLSYINATVYYPAGNSTWTEEIREDHSGGALTWVAIDMPNYYGFWLNKDGWCFANAAESFGEDSQNLFYKYFIPRERYDEVFGTAYWESNRFSKEWKGNCAGMSVTAILFFLDYLDWKAIDNSTPKNFYTPNSFYHDIYYHYASQSGYATSGNDTELTRLIEAYQLYINEIKKHMSLGHLVNTYWTERPTESKTLSGSKYIINHVPRGTYISSMLEVFRQAYEENTPLYISLQGDDFAHAIVSRTDKKPEDMGNGWWRVYVYDPNKPYINDTVAGKIWEKHPNAELKYACNDLKEDVYIELNPFENLWRYRTSVNSSSSSKYVGCGVDNQVQSLKVQYRNDEERIVRVEMPEFFCIIDLNDIQISDYTHPTTTAWMPANPDDGSAISADGSSNFAVYSASGELVAVVENGEGIVLNGSGYYVGYIGGTEASSPAGGKLYLPNDVYTVKYTSGQIAFLGCNNAISITGDAPMEFTVDVVKNSVQILAASDGTVSIRCANVISPDECSYVETEGILLAGETLSIAYPDNNKVQAATDSKDGQFQLYQKNADQEESVATSIIKSGSLDWRWIVVGVAAAGVVLFILIRKKKSNA